MKNCQTTKSWHFPGRNSLKLSYCSEDKLFKLHFLNKCILDGVCVLFCFKKTFRPKKGKKGYLPTNILLQGVLSTLWLFSTYQSGFVFSNVHADINKPWGGLIQVLQQWDCIFLQMAGRYLRGWWKKQQWQSKFKTIYNSIRSTDRFSEE